MAHLGLERALSDLGRALSDLWRALSELWSALELWLWDPRRFSAPALSESLTMILLPMTVYLLRLYFI